jgi:hypothetical protein
MWGMCDKISYSNVMPKLSLVECWLQLKLHSLIFFYDIQQQPSQFGQDASKIEEKKDKLESTFGHHLISPGHVRLLNFAPCYSYL